MLWDILTYACILAAALVLAVDTTIRQSRKLPERAPSFVRGKLWGYTPLTLMIAAGLIFFIKSFDDAFSQPPVREFPQQSTTLAASTPTPLKPLTEASEEPASSPTKTIIVDSQIKRLTEIFNGRTAVQATHLADVHLSHTISLSGTVYNIYSDSIVFQRLTSEDPTASMYFDESSTPMLSTLKRGDQVTVRGKIAEIMADEVVLKHCQITNIANEK
jgi:hypothetical protein